GERSRDSGGDRRPAQGLRRGFDRGARARRRHFRVPERRVRGDHGPERLGQEHPAAHPGRPGQADRWARRRRRHGALGPLGQGADAPQARADGVRLPVLQPHTDALGGGERAPAGPDLRQEAGQVREAPRRAARPGRPHGPPLAPPGRALGRRAAAGRHSPRPHTLPRHHPRRRADRQPGLQDRRRGARP
ncbi:MAG: ABC transporter, ATP-binding protein, partial [uncultured Rubrobacteraceae bacterium]